MALFGLTLFCGGCGFDSVRSAADFSGIVVHGSKLNYYLGLLTLRYEEISTFPDDKG